MDPWVVAPAELFRVSVAGQRKLIRSWGSLILSGKASGGRTGSKEGASVDPFSGREDDAQG